MTHEQQLLDVASPLFLSLTAVPVDAVIFFLMLLTSAALLAVIWEHIAPWDEK